MDLLNSIHEKVKEYKLQRQAEHELFQLTDRELQDLGINRCDIYRVVYKAYTKDK
jgi:uncharacterized protein YjiS (DUF1127 family)